MARQYIVTEEEMLSLVDQLKLQALSDNNVCEPGKELTAEERDRLKWAIDSLHRGFHFVVVRWLQNVVGFHALRDYSRR